MNLVLIAGLILGRMLFDTAIVNAAAHSRAQRWVAALAPAAKREVPVCDNVC